MFCFFSDENYICYALSYGFSSSDPNEALNHTSNCQLTQKNEKLSIKQKLFDDRVGTLVYRRIDFGILILFNYNILHAQHVSLSTRYVNKLLRHTKVRVKDPRLGQEHT